MDQQSADIASASLEEKHAKARARDQARLDSGEATAQQIQDENSLLRHPRKWSLPYLTA